MQAYLARALTREVLPAVFVQEHISTSCQTEFSYLQIKTCRHRQITSRQSITNFLISIINLTRSRAFQIENICCILEIPGYRAELQCDLKISPHGLQMLVDFWLKKFPV